MKNNTNDYVEVNGKKYYLIGDDDKRPIRNASNRIYTKKNSLSSQKRPPSENSGHVFFNRADDVIKNDKGEIIYDPAKKGSRKEEILRGKREAVDFLRYYEKLHPGTAEKYAIDIDALESEINRFDPSKHINEKNWKAPEIKTKFDGFDNENFRRLNYFLAQYDPSLFDMQGAYSTKVGNKEYWAVPYGRNMASSYGQFYFDRDEDGNPIINKNAYRLNYKQKNNLQNIIGEELANKFNRYNNYTGFVDENGYRHVLFEDDWEDVGDNSYKAKKKGVTVLDNDGNAVKIVPEYKDVPVRNSVGGREMKKVITNYHLAKDGENGAVDYLDDVYNYSEKTKQPYIYYYENNEAMPYKQDKKSIFRNLPTKDYDMDKGEYAFGGHTSRRLYAVGGLTGEQIPIGEQPEDYNMVGAGGSHEQNPMGGVPYGVNQDGSQNMVEEGEVSVGNNVFSDRTAISPELCQQLGLPEGTTPAQAMQQIEALYEQGQIEDEEFQEIQQIIFEDQEAQKQNVGQSEVDEEGVPQEGITPEMMGQMQQMSPQQGGIPQQPEGITPEMMQGAAPTYAYGGKMNYWR